PWYLPGWVGLRRIKMSLPVPRALADAKLVKESRPRIAPRPGCFLPARARTVQSNRCRLLVRAWREIEVKPARESDVLRRLVAREDIVVVGLESEAPVLPHHPIQSKAAANTELRLRIADVRTTRRRDLDLDIVETCSADQVRGHLRTLRGHHVLGVHAVVEELGGGIRARPEHGVERCLVVIAGVVLDVIPIEAEGELRAHHVRGIDADKETRLELITEVAHRESDTGACI